MKEGSEKVFGAGYNVLPYRPKRLTAQTQVATPNSDVIYAVSYLDLHAKVSIGLKSHSHAASFSDTHRS
jgi:hypothetical protein